MTVPAGINDETMIALWNVVDKRFSNIDLTPLLVYYIDIVPASALYTLACQFGVEGDKGWNFVTTDYEKRRLIKNAIKYKKTKGTGYALRTAFELLGITAVITESKDYGGRPNRFKLNLKSNTIYDDGKLSDRIKKFVEEYKNVRSVLEGVNLELQQKSICPYVGGASRLKLIYKGT